LLAAQNKKTDEQLKLLDDQNGMLVRQLDLLKDQNTKIDQQTMVADTQKRSAFVTELFSIVQEVAKLERSPASRLPVEIAARIIVLTSSAAPYVYLDFRSDTADGSPKRIPKPLSPERGQILAALARMKVNFVVVGRSAI
jgi:hypothetical protein